MDENNRKVPPVQRGNIDGIQIRRTDALSPPSEEAPKVDNQELKEQAPPEQKIKEHEKRKPKKNKNLLAIILAVCVLVGLSGLAVYVGLQQNANDPKDGQSGQAASEQANNPDKSTELIDQTISEIDRLDNESDSSGQGLSDDNLGL